MFSKARSAHSAQSQFKTLDLQGDSKARVEEYHREVVEQYMDTIPGARRAMILHLAHAKGSRDPCIHISAKILNKEGDPILIPRRSDPTKMFQVHHVYTNSDDPPHGYHNLPHDYKNAVDKLNKIEGQPTGEGSI